MSDSTLTMFCDNQCEKYYGGLSKKYCMSCSTEIDKTSKKVYCSISCHNTHQRTKNQVVYTCVECQIPFTVQKSSKRTKTCSKVCEKKWTASDIRNDSRMETLRQNNLEQFGVEFTFQRDDVTAKTKATKISRYNSSGYCNSIKGTQTKLEKYGTLDFSDKIKDTRMKRYGTLDANKKGKITKLKKYGTLDFSDKARKTTIERYGSLEARLLEESYTKLQKKYSSIVHFDFQVTQYFGTTKYRKYSFICVLCSTPFDDNMTNGIPPRCPTCYPQVAVTQSSHEFEIVDWLKAQLPGITIIHGDRTILAPKEIDIWLPEYKVGIELNGTRWHTDLRGKGKYYHLHKTEAAAQQGIQILHILDTEWTQKQEIVKSLILAKLGESNKIFARKCSIQEIPKKQAEQFFARTHIQGTASASVSVGLFYNNTLVSCMSFVKSRYSKRVQWEISRFSSELYTSISGGAAKLFSYFIRKFTPESVITYSDRRLFSGKIYASLGMSFQQYTAPAYTYVSPTNALYSRLAFQKHKLSKKLSVFDPAKTEWQNMQDNGYDRIWDCGHAKFLWTKPT